MANLSENLSNGKLQVEENFQLPLCVFRICHFMTNGTRIFENFMVITSHVSLITKEMNFFETEIKEIYESEVCTMTNIKNSSP